MTQPDLDETRGARSLGIEISLVLVAAAVLRFWALGHGIPFAVGADEPEIIFRVVRMMKTGDFNPHFFDYPGLYLYVQLVVASARFLFGAAEGLWRSLDQVGPDDFYLWGRAATAALGTVTVYLVFAIGRRWGRWQALVSAMLMAVMPLHVRESHFVLTDVPMTFFVALAFLLALRANERGTIASFAWAGAGAGLAAATKYYGGLVLLVPVGFALAGDRLTAGRRLLACLTATGAAAGAFLAAAPYTLLDLPDFLNGFAAMSTALAGRGAGADPGWLIYLKHLRLALGWPGSAVLVFGVAVALTRAVRGPDRLGSAFLVLFPCLFFWILSSRTLIFGRYLMPIVPFVALIIGIGIVSGVQLLRHARLPRPVVTALVAALVAAVLLPPAVTAVRFNLTASRTSTYEILYMWILEQVPAGARVAIETAGLRLPGDRYRVEQLKMLIQWDHDTFQAQGFDYLVASSQAFGAALEKPHLRPQEYAAYRRLFDQLEMVTTVVPSDSHPGPELRVYRVSRDVVR